MAWARISDDSTALEVNFDSAVRSQDSDRDWAYWCSLLPLEGSLGVKPICAVKDEASVNIYFGQTASLLPGYVVALPSWARRTADPIDSPVSAQHNVLIYPSLRPSIPQVLLSCSVLFNF